MSAGNQIGILIADQDAGTRYRLLDLIIGQPDMYVIGSLPTHTQALGLALQVPPDVILLDIREEEGGLEGLRLLRERLPDVRLIVWSAYAHEPQFVACYRIGADDCLTKDQAASDLLVAIRNIPVRQGVENLSLDGHFAEV